MSAGTRKEAEALIVEKAGKDERFRKQLIDDPRAVVARELGIELSPEFRVNVVQESATNIYIVLPPRPVPDGELSDADLDQVAGGMDSGKGGIARGGEKLSVQQGGLKQV